MDDPNKPGPSGQHGGDDDAQSRKGEIRRIVNRFAQRERERARRTEHAQEAQQAQQAQSPTPNYAHMAPSPIRIPESPTNRFPLRPRTDSDPFGPDRGKGPELPPPEELPVPYSPERSLKDRVLRWYSKNARRTTMGDHGSASPHKQGQLETPVSRWVSETSRSLIPKGRDLALQAGPHYEVNNVAELGKFLASADRVLSLCGTPVADMKYTVVVVPAGDLNLLIRGYGDFEGEESPSAVLEMLQAGQALRGAHEQAGMRCSQQVEDPSDDGSHSVATTTFRGSRSGITRWQGPPTPAKGQAGESSQPKTPGGSRPDQERSPAPAPATLTFTVRRSPDKGKGKEKEVAPVTRRLLSPDARKLVEAVLVCDQEKQREERTKAERWKSPRSKLRRLSDTANFRDHQQIDSAFRYYQRNVYSQVAEIMELLGKGEREENPGIDGKV